jgi:hypothetical protein
VRAPSPENSTGATALALGRVALAHDYLNQRGGAERVALELARMWPDAPLYTSLYRPESTFPEFREVDVRTSFLDRLPVDAGFRNLLPLYPSAFAALGPVDADVLITSSSGWAHGLRVRSPGRHVVYCHNPARWLYGEQYLGASSAQQKAIAPLRAWLRRWDRGQLVPVVGRQDPGAHRSRGPRWTRALTPPSRPEHPRRRWPPGRRQVPREHVLTCHRSAAFRLTARTRTPLASSSPGRSFHQALVRTGILQHARCRSPFAVLRLSR